MMTRWECTAIQGKSSGIQTLVQQLNEAGSQGWELVGFIGIKKELARDTATAVLKRQTLPAPPS